MKNETKIKKLQKQINELTRVKNSTNSAVVLENTVDTIKDIQKDIEELKKK